MELKDSLFDKIQNENSKITIVLSNFKELKRDYNLIENHKIILNKYLEIEELVNKDKPEMYLMALNIMNEPFEYFYEKCWRLFQNETDKFWPNNAKMNQDLLSHLEQLRKNKKADLLYTELVETYDKISRLEQYTKKRPNFLIEMINGNKHSKNIKELNDLMTKEKHLKEKLNELLKEKTVANTV